MTCAVFVHTRSLLVILCFSPTPWSSHINCLTPGLRKYTFSKSQQSQRCSNGVCNSLAIVGKSLKLVWNSKCQGQGMQHPIRSADGPHIYLQKICTTHRWLTRCSAFLMHLLPFLLFFSFFKICKIHKSTHFYRLQILPLETMLHIPEL